MDIPKMREYIKNAYPGPSWRRKCNNMSKEQVIAVYKSITSRARNGKKPKPLPMQEEEGYQFTIFDKLKEEN